MALRDIAYINPKSILDCGAGIGDWYREAKALWPDAYFVLIEGNGACMEALNQTGERYICAYLSDTRGGRDLYRRPGGGTDTGNSFYRELTPFFEYCDVVRVPVSPLSDLADFPDDQFDLIKLDCQGAELDIIRGGEEIFSRAKWVLMEVALTEYNEGAPLKDEVFAFMQERDFWPKVVVQDIVHPISREVVQKDVLFSK